jgi:hypothetical protein
MNHKQVAIVFVRDRCGTYRCDERRFRLPPHWAYTHSGERLTGGFHAFHDWRVRCFYRRGHARDFVAPVPPVKSRAMSDIGFPVVRTCF